VTSRTESVGSGRQVESRHDGAPTGIVTQTHSSHSEMHLRECFHQLYKESPIPDSEQLQQLGLFTSRQVLARTLFFDQMYREIIEVPGVIMEFGTRWGRDLSAFASMRGMYEPYNYTRRILGFDTFKGFPSTHAVDEGGGIAAAGGFSTTPDYELYLDRVMQYHEAESPLSHIRKFELIKGDVTETLPAYLEQHPETLISLAYFDLDLYEPTVAALQAILPHLTKGAVLGFDELNYPEFPGETTALREVLPIREYRFRRAAFDPTPCYTVIE
jgi:hypothetical protein